MLLPGTPDPPNLPFVSSYSCSFEAFITSMNGLYRAHGGSALFLGRTTFSNAYFAFAATKPQVNARKGLRYGCSVHTRTAMFRIL